MNILVTGGAGFIGSNLCRYLRDMGHRVYSLDCYFTGSIENHYDDVTYIDDSTTNISDYTFKKLDLIYHLGEFSRVSQSFGKSKLIMEMNIRGTYNVFEYAREHNVKIVYAGSSTKFGIYNEKDIISPYVWAKSANTELLKMYAKWYDMKIAIAYFYNAYGKHEIQTGEYATLIAKFLRHKKLFPEKSVDIHFPGTQTRNFTHVNDIIRGLYFIGLYGEGDEFGIGAKEAYSIIDIAKMLGLKYNIVPSLGSNRITTQLITKRTKELGWKPQYKLKDYLEENNV